MEKYSKANVEDLKRFIYFSNIHDACLKYVNYDRANRILDVHTTNAIFDTRINLRFINVRQIVLNNRDEKGSRDTILSFSVEDSDFLCVLFQMFSGDEIQIVFDEVMIEVAG